MAKSNNKQNGEKVVQKVWAGENMLLFFSCLTLLAGLGFCTLTKYFCLFLLAKSSISIAILLFQWNFTLRRYWGCVPRIDKQCHQSSQLCLISDTLSSQSIDKVCEPFLLPSRIEYKDQANQNTAPGEKILRVVCCHSGQPNRSPTIFQYVYK